MNEKKKASGTDKLVNAVIAVAIAAFVCAGVYATYGKISEGIEEKAITNGEKEADVEYLAKQANMTVEDYLAQYGLTLSDTVTKDSTESDMTDNMTIENYLKYTGMEQTADQVISDAGLTDTVTKDTLWKDFMPQMPVKMVYDETTFNQIKEQLALGDDVTMDMSYGDFEKILEQAANEAQAAAEETAQTAAPDAEQAPEETAAADEAQQPQG